MQQIDMRPEWDRTSARVLRSIESAVNSGVPPASVAFYARWWQVETWLRQLAYMELRAKYGAAWLDHLAGAAALRAVRDEINAYMATPDATDLLAYLDVTHLFDLIDSKEHWILFEQSLLPRRRWRGTVDELKVLRHRSAHCRRPHADDLNKVEQVLRNLEAGARIALEAHNVQWQFEERNEADPIVTGWLLKEHPDALRLVDHALTNYDVELQLRWSKRPWAKLGRRRNLAGLRGIYIHATFVLRRSFVDPAWFWQELIAPNRSLQRLLVYLVVDDPYTLSFTFAAVDGADLVNGAIGNAFDAVLMGGRPGTIPFDALKDKDWARGAEKLDPRIQINAPLNVAHPEQPFSVFGAASF